MFQKKLLWKSTQCIRRVTPMRMTASFFGLKYAVAVPEANACLAGHFPSHRNRREWSDVWLRTG